METTILIKENEPQPFLLYSSTSLHNINRRSKQGKSGLNMYKHQNENILTF